MNELFKEYSVLFRRCKEKICVVEVQMLAHHAQFSPDEFTRFVREAMREKLEKVKR